MDHSVHWIKSLGGLKKRKKYVIKHSPKAWMYLYVEKFSEFGQIVFMAIR